MNSDELTIQAIESRLRPVRPRGQLPKYGADSALSSLVKRQITGVRVFLRWLGYWAWHRTAESRQNRPPDGSRKADRLWENESPRTNAAIPERRPAEEISGLIERRHIINSLLETSSTHANPLATINSRAG